MGLAVATSLSARPDWSIHILDLNATSGKPIAASLHATFHQSDVTNYAQLSAIFKSVFQTHRRLDFVFANAGIAEHANFFNPVTNGKSKTNGNGISAGKDGKEAKNEEVSLEPPPEPKGLHPLIDINLKAVITTTTLAHFYMRLSPPSTTTSSPIDKSIIMTASCGGLYPAYASPIYTATKHAVVGFMRSIAPSYYAHDGIRVNAICPGTVKTNLLSNEEWRVFPEEYFTPVEKIARVVVMLVDGVDGGEGRGVVGGGSGREIGKGQRGDAEGRVGTLSGKAVEVSGERHYYREAVEFCDEPMRAVMGATNIESWGLESAK
ncbi:NAD(P)-binding protein [Lophiostoma macrostomum CBS 122681]|uniref:NAD(P)-binding protein n=1 Tax=Lophiostoma macrostomum CBS 122681 TaxID=1314788 RepID=A0A6A6SSJ9_9PLEO|nr:NAD(P)-binding protein [Lophiostoma macrostomum CBS 122681]